MDNILRFISPEVDKVCIFNDARDLTDENHIHMDKQHAMFLKYALVFEANQPKAQGFKNFSCTYKC